MALANAGEGVDDANFDREFADSIRDRVHHFATLATDPPATRSEPRRVDDWFRSRLQEIIAATTEHMEATRFRSALKTGFFDLQSAWRWYERRTDGTPHEEVLDAYVTTQTRLLTPFVPHVAEEIHEARGGTGFAVDQPWPTVDEELVDEQAQAGEAFVRSVLDDAQEILQVTDIDPTRVIAYTAPAWKTTVYRTALDLALDDELEMGRLMDEAMGDEDVREHKKRAPDLAQELVQDLATLGEDELERRRVELDEHRLLSESEEFLGGELGAPVEVYAADADEAPDPSDKARHARPRRPAIYVE
jgi:leucyl-tRNA synthetase